jgi:hypothetical protein
MTSDGENGLLRVKFRINLCIGLGSNLRSWFSRPVVRNMKRKSRSVLSSALIQKQTFSAE